MASEFGRGRSASRHDCLLASGTGRIIDRAVTLRRNGNRSQLVRQRRNGLQPEAIQISRLREREERKRLKKFRSPRKVLHQLWAAPQSDSETTAGSIRKSAKQARVKTSTPTLSLAAMTYHQPAAQKTPVSTGFLEDSAGARSEQGGKDTSTEGGAEAWRVQEVKDVPVAVFVDKGQDK
ncbi:unnamed protein product, partial [Ostreobium quekettii]